jgi:hypothetical protein
MSWMTSRCNDNHIVLVSGKTSLKMRQLLHPV